MVAPRNGFFGPPAVSKPRASARFRGAEVGTDDGTVLGGASAGSSPFCERLPKTIRCGTDGQSVGCDPPATGTPDQTASPRSDRFDFYFSCGTPCRGQLVRGDSWSA